MAHADRLDVIRSTTNVALAAAQPLAVYLTRWSGRGVSEEERANRVSGPVTPAPGAFAIWGPLFATSIVDAIRSASDSRHQGRAENRVAWLTSATYASNAAWSVQAQLRGLGWPSVGLIVVSAVTSTLALIQAEHASERSSAARRTARSVAPLAGWLTAAAFANVESTLNETRGRPDPERETQRSLIFLGMTTATVGSVSLASRGNLLYSAAVSWALGSIAIKNWRNGNRRAAVGAIVALATTGIFTGLARRLRAH
jgi:hypothetical protein